MIDVMHVITENGMQLNSRMRRLLDRLRIDAPLSVDAAPTLVSKLRDVDGCVFLAEEYERCRKTDTTVLQDKTGVECFVNHVHFRVGRGRKALQSVFQYIAELRGSLLMVGPGEYQIIASVAGGNATVRFHKLRLGESWLAEDLEMYKHEAVMSIQCSR